MEDKVSLTVVTGVLLRNSWCETYLILSEE